MATKTVLITGAAKRVGAVVALEMAKAGWDVAIHYNNSSKEANALVKEIKALGRKAIAIKVNLADEKAIKKLMEKASAGLGGITCLINNASVFHKDTLQTLTAASWREHMEINTLAPLLLTQAFAAQLPKGEKGNIIHMLDYVVWNLSGEFISYVNSKAALWALTQSLALALAPRIRVNAIGPGHTLMNSKENKARFEAARKATPLQNGADPEEIAQGILFLLNSPSVTGQMIAMDGGKHLIGAEFY